MLYTIDCPNCGAQQKNLDLEETGGSFICSECGAEIKVDLKKEQKKHERVGNKSLE